MKSKKHLVLFFLPLFLSISMNSCKDEKETFTTFPEPTWKIINDENYPVNMTAVVAIPDFLSKYASENDQLAAFAGETCRGVGEIVDGLYFVTIKGTFDEEVDIYFQYYSGRNMYLYKTSVLFTFEKDNVYGTADEPKILPLSPVE